MRLLNPRNGLKCELIIKHPDLDWSHRSKKNGMNKNTNCTTTSFPRPTQPIASAAHGYLTRLRRKKCELLGSVCRGGRAAAQRSRGSPHLVVLGRECCSASEQGGAQPGGVGVSGGGFSRGSCWVIVVAQVQTTTAIEYWTKPTIISTKHCLPRVHTVEASRRAALRVFNPKHEAACSWNVTSTIVPCCSCVAAEGESIRGAHDDQRRSLHSSVSK